MQNTTIRTNSRNINGNNQATHNNHTNRHYTIVRRKRNTRRISKLVVITMTFLMLIFGTFVVLESSWKIIDTSIELVDINCQTQFYNEQVRITDEMTEEQEKLNEERQALYNSNDYVIRSFSTQNFLVKALILVLAVVAVFKLPATWKFILKGMTKIIFDDEKSRTTRRTKRSVRVSVKK